MKVFIKGCFQKVAYQLIHELVDQDFEVHGYDNVENDDEKFERYAMVGRHASFQLEQEYDENSPFDYCYDFTTRDELCTFCENQGEILKIYLDEARNEGLSSVEIASWLAKLHQYSSLPVSLYINGDTNEGVHFVKIK